MRECLSEDLKSPKDLLVVHRETLHFVQGDIIILFP
jgi:hypothetical protein